MAMIVTNKQMRAWRQKTEQRIDSITHTPNMPMPTGAPVFYVANDGCDENDGLTPETPWKTLDKVNDTALASGTVVRFRRGDLWRGQIRAKTGVTYTAYGEGEKPKLYGSPMDGADPALWEKTDTVNIWRFHGFAEDTERSLDIGTIVFDHGKAHAIKAIIRYEKDGSHWNNTTGERFRSWRDLTADLHFFHDLTDGNVYLHSEENPGERFSSIEFSIKRHGFAIQGSNVTIDNFCVCYVGSHGVGAGTTQGLTVQNCIFRWIGGSIQAEGIFGRNHATRYGNAVEIYGGCDRYTVQDCYFYQIYDAAVTHQVGLTQKQKDEGADLSQTHIRYRRNVMEYCNYSIEYFLSGIPEGNLSRMEDLVIEDNYMWYAGRGLSSQRPDKTEAAHIKSWNHDNPAKDYHIRNNLMVDSYNMLLHIHADVRTQDGSDGMPTLEGNTFAAREEDSFGNLAFCDPTRQPYPVELPGNEMWIIE